MSTEHTLAENLLRLQSATEDIADAITEKGGTASYSDGLEAMGDKIRAIPNPQPVLTTKTIVQNGTYTASSDNVDGYSSVVANVPNTYTASDEGKVVSNGALVSQGSDTVTENGTVDTTLIGSLIVNVESGGEIPKQKSTKPALSGVREVYGSYWSAKTWSGLTPDGNYIWTDGDNIYYSNSSNQYVLDKSTSTWSSKSWSGLTSFSGEDIWSDGDNIYYSVNDSNQYVLDKLTSTWIRKTWSGSIPSASFIWTDGNNIYDSYSSDQYVLDKSTSTWSSKSWSGTSPDGRYIWTDGDNIYYSNNDTQYVLNKATSRWTKKTWSGLTSFYGSYIWTDGDNIYYSYGSSSSPEHYVLNKSTSSWSSKAWYGLTNFYGQYIWTDGDNIYYSNGSTHYVLNKQPKPTTLTTSCKPKFNSSIPTPYPILTTKSITSNGTYDASSDNADGYSEVSVDVPNSYTAQDDGKVVQSGALVAQGSDSVTENGVVDTTLISSLTVNVPTATFEACELIKSSGLGGEVYGFNTEDRTIVAGLLYKTGSYSSIVLTFPQGFTPRYTKAAYGVMSAYYDYGYNSAKSITSINITNSSITLELNGFSSSSQTKQVPICMQFSTN